MNNVLYKMKDGCEKYAPIRIHSNDAGFDLYAIEDVFLYPNKPTLVSTGLHIKLPHEESYIWEAQVRSKSGKALSGILVAISPGTIDEDYTDEIKVITININNERIKLSKGTRFAQLVITRIPRINLINSDFESNNSRGGFGSTGDK